MNRTPAKSHKSGFTLLEVLVTVGIIALLIGILIPTLGHVKKSARRSAAESQLRGIAMACDAYYTMFNAYPGFVAETAWATAATRGNFSNSQALVVALSGRYFPSDPANAPYSLSATDFPAVQIDVAGQNRWVMTNPNISPRNYAVNTGATPPGRDYDQFIKIKPSDLSTTALPNLYSPTFADSPYGVDALPILYYRQHVKFEPVGMGTTGWIQENSATIAPYYVDSNSHLAALTTPESDNASVAFNASLISNIARGQSAANKQKNFKPILTQKIGNADTPRGAYVLISAGPDRIYGLDADGKCDDIVVSGGN